MKFRSGVVLGAVLATAALAVPAQAAPIGQGFTITPADLAYILKQIKIAEAHVANTTSETGPCGALLGTGPDQLPSPLLSLGLRTVDGTCNNLIAGQETYGAADQLFPRLGRTSYRAAENARPASSAPAARRSPPRTRPRTTATPSSTPQPRLISNLIADQTANNPAAVAAAGQPGPQPDRYGHPGRPTVRTAVHPERHHRRRPLRRRTTRWFTLFGQFFDHGIDQTVKGGGTVIVPLSADDPLIAGPDRIPGNADDPKPGDAKYVPPSMRFMALTRAANQPGPDGKSAPPTTCRRPRTPTRRSWTSPRPTRRTRLTRSSSASTRTTRRSPRLHRQPARRRRRRPAHLGADQEAGPRAARPRSSPTPTCSTCR